MKINHILEDFSKLSGGLRTVVNDLNTNIKNSGFSSQIISTKAEIEDSIILAEPNLYKNIWCYSNKLKQILLTNTTDIFHIHGVWMYPQYIASKTAYEKTMPYVITPHGMLEPWLWEHGTVKKKIYFQMMIKKYFENANALHAITPDEKNNLYSLLKHKNIEVIPNSISYADIEAYKIERKSTQKYILFVGRLHPKKGIDLLIETFAKLKHKDIVLKVAGPFNEYKIELESLANDLGIKHKVEFLGLVSGREKYQLYKDAWVFVAPSFSEVVGMVNLEAGILGTPVITTYQTGVYKEWDQNGGILINPKIDELASAMSNAIEWSETERNDRGEKLKDYIKKHYSWETNILRWIELYRSIEND